MFFGIILFAYSINDVIIQYETGNYKNAITMGEEIFEKIKNDISDKDAINLQTYIAFSYVAIGDTLNAQKYFENILMIDKNYTLNEEFVSPKIIKIFKKAKNRINYLIQDMPDYFKINKEKNYIKFSKTNLFLKSAILPGWGQYDANEKYKSLTIASAFSVTAIGTIISYIAFVDAKNRYLNSEDNIEAVENYDAYNNMFKINKIFLDLLISTYIFNLWDILWQKL